MLDLQPEIGYNKDVDTNEENGPFLLPNFLTIDIIGNRAAVLNGPTSFVSTATYEGLRDCGFFISQKNRTGGVNTDSILLRQCVCGANPPTMAESIFAMSIAYFPFRFKSIGGGYDR